MSKQVIMYGESNDSVRFAQVDEGTFALAEKADGTFESMTYSEWEALRCRQACEKVVAEQLDGLSDDAQKKLAGYLEEFSATMQQKYLEGKLSWAQLFKLLAKDFKALV